MNTHHGKRGDVSQRRRTAQVSSEQAYLPLRGLASFIAFFPSEDWHHSLPSSPPPCSAARCLHVQPKSHHGHAMSKSKAKTKPAASTQSLGLLTSLRFGGGLLLVPRFAVHSGEDWNYHLTGGGEEYCRERDRSGFGSGGRVPACLSFPSGCEREQDHHSPRPSFYLHGRGSRRTDIFFCLFIILLLVEFPFPSF
ncbi:hypothetical protein LZ30DRAFT_731794 [Colletotrichum cereale]|nr:hypothetical protein LZ30DRAFT_731794 [Colletotrichum cereale]